MEDAFPLIFESADCRVNPGLDGMDASSSCSGFFPSEMDVFASHSGMQLVSSSTGVLGGQLAGKLSMPATAVQTPGSPSSCVSQLNPRAKQIGPEVEIFSSSLGAMVSLLAKLSSLLVSPEDQLPEPLKLHKDKLELLKEDVEGLNTFLVNLSWVEAPNMMVKHWMNEVRDLSYDIEDYIDKTMHPGPNWHFDSEVEELSTLMKQAKDAHDRYNRYDLGRWASNPRFVVDEQSQVPIPRLNGETTVLIGISDSKAELIKRLNNGAEQRLVVCIQGSPGVGKTTLAKEVYYEMEGQFECRAFVRASKMPDTRRLLSGIISQIQHRRQGPPHGQHVQELIDSLRKYLQQKRYLIVIDGLWETTSWDIVSSAFPDDAHCSRILITTDIEEVALECCDYESDAIFKMEPLGGNSSTELFFNRVFGFKHECSKQLMESSEEIIRTCGGLPLAIISIASILAIQPDNLELWRHVKEALFSRLRYNLTFEVMLREIVVLSFNSLPHHLKTCLLYLSMYPEGYTFLKADLVKQWSAEGFIIAVEEKNCDEVAECYFDELICRGLIQPNHTNISDEVILYTLHSTVFEVIRTMSNEENFCTVIDYSNTISEPSVKVRRLSLRFSSAKYATKPESITLSPVRSLIFYGLVKCLPSTMEFEVLRVLILEVWGDQEELDLSGIGRLFQLRYMRITSNIIVKLPARMIGLPYLQTMEIYARVTSVPSDIVCLPRLLHLCVHGEINLSNGIGHMRSLRTIQSFDLSSNSEDTIWELGEMTDLCDLHVTSTTEMSKPVKRKFIAFVSSLEKLSNLKSIILAPVPSCTSISLDCSRSISSLSVFLQRLELLPPICIFSRLPVWIGQLRKLFILKIVLRELTTGDVDIIAKLQELTILSLYVRQPIAELIVFHPAAFPVLKCFKFRCGIMHIAFQPDAMPSLQRLKLEFNAHSGEQNGNMLAGIEHLLNLQEITGRIGAAPGAEETDRMAAEFLFKDAISKHSRLTNFNLRIVQPFEEEISRFADTPASCSGSATSTKHEFEEHKPAQLMRQRSRTWSHESRQPSPGVVRTQFASGYPTASYDFRSEKRLRELREDPQSMVKQLLTKCAEALSQERIEEFLNLVQQARGVVSITGEPIQRLGAYLLEGLVARHANSGTNIYRALKCLEPESNNNELLSYMKILYNICPYFKFGYMAANGAIAEALRNEDKIHIIDFQIAQGTQWITLIQALAARPEGKPHVRITGIDDPVSEYARGEGLDLVGKMLKSMSEEFRIPLEFTPLPGIYATQVTKEILDIRPGEALAVNFTLQLHHTPDESVDVNNPRDGLLRMVKGLSPKVTTLVEQESHTNTTPFLMRFTETLDYYSAMFESIDTNLPRENKERINVEQHCLAKDIVNIIACEGKDRVERHELLGKWRSRLTMAGFRPYPLSSYVNSVIRKLLACYSDKYTLEEKDGAMLLGWKNRKLISASAWH